MKIFYLSYFEQFDASGITHKIEGLSDALTAIGHKIQWAIFTPSVRNTDHLSYNNRHRVIVCRAHDYSTEVIEYIRNNCDAASVIFFRYPLASPSLAKICEAFPGRIIFEHNTIELRETLLRIKNISLRDLFYLLRTGNLNSYITAVRHYRNESKWAPHVLTLAAGGIAVTDEIARYQALRSPGYRCITVGNGICVEHFRTFTSSPPGKNGLETLMICSNSNPWHGTDRLLMGLAIYQGKYPVTLHLIGRFEPVNYRWAKKIIPPNRVIFHGFLPPDKIETIKQNCHLAIGSLGLHRIPLQEGSVLKVREYLASGIPVVLGYDDTDIQNSPLSLFSLRIPADESPVNWDELVAFALKIYQESGSGKRIREEAVKRIDFSTKAEEYLSAFKNLYPPCNTAGISGTSS